MTIFSIIIIILIVFSQFFFVPLVEKTAETRLKNATQASTAAVSLQTMPAVLLLLGQVDNVDMKAENAMLGQVRVQELTLKGKNVGVDPFALDAQDGSAVRRADTLELTGTITAENLADLLRRKVDKLENVEVTITPEIVSASAQVKLGGRMADLHLEGVLFDDNGSVYFRMTKLDIKNALFGKAVIGNFFGDILLINLHALPFSAELDRVVQKVGEVVLMASRHNK